MQELLYSGEYECFVVKEVCKYSHGDGTPHGWARGVYDLHSTELKECRKAVAHSASGATYTVGNNHSICTAGLHS